MTRINCVPVEELSGAHLIAEYREMLRLRGAHPLKNRAPLPTTYRMGEGHVRFFYDKGAYLVKRHRQLRAEMVRRNITPAYSLDLSHWPDEYMNDWTPTPEALAINRERIAKRIRDAKRG